MSRVVLIVLASLWLAGCGGGTSLSVEPKSLTFLAKRDGAVPSPQTVKATFKGHAVLVGVPPGAQVPPWLDITHASSDKDGAFFRFSIKTTSLSEGTYPVTIRFVTGTEEGSDLKSEDVSVTYTVQPPDTSSSLRVSPTSLDFTSLSGQATAPSAKTVTISGSASQPVGFTVTATSTSGPTDWLSFQTSGTTSATMSVGPHSAALPPGTYSATLVFTSADGKNSAQLLVSYRVSAPSFSVSPGRLDFQARSGESTLPWAQSVTVSSNGPALSYSVSASYTGSTQGWLGVPSPGTTPRNASIQPNTTALPPGSHNAVLTFTPNNGQVAVQLTVTYTVTAPRLVLSPSQLSFTTYSGQGVPPAAQSVSITGEQGTAVGYTASVTYSAGAQNWLTLPPSGAAPRALSVQPNTTALPAGQYSAVVRFTPSNGQSATQLTVTYDVAASELRVNPGAPTLHVHASTTEAQLSSALAVTSTGAPLSWRVVSVDAPWLDVPLASGNTQSNTSLSLVVRKDALAGMDNGTSSGTITLAYNTASTAEQQLVVNVQLTVALPRVRTVSPYAIEAGQSYSHILRGEGFSGLQSAQGLRFSTTEVKEFQVISDTEIRLIVPALPVGAHVVLANNTLGVSRPGATLHAVRTPTFTEASLSRGGKRRPGRTLYDPLRTAIYTLDFGTEYWSPLGLYRTRYVNGTWEEAAYVYLPNMYDAAMDIDGQSLYLSIGTGLYRLDLNDATATPRFIRTIPEYSDLEVMNDGTLLVEDSSCWNMVRSLDGRRAMRVASGCTSGNYYPIRVFEASTGQYEPTPIYTTVGSRSSLALERTARYAVVSNSIYDAQWNLISGLTTPLYGLLFSPDGRRLYGFHAASSYQMRMHVYDVSRPPTGGQFPRIHDALVTGGTADDAYGSDAIITPNGQTLMTVSQNRFYVWPIPASLQ